MCVLGPGGQRSEAGDGGCTAPRAAGKTSIMSFSFSDFLWGQVLGQLGDSRRPVPRNAAAAFLGPFLWARHHAK